MNDQPQYPYYPEHPQGQYPPPPNLAPDSGPYTPSQPNTVYPQQPVGYAQQPYYQQAAYPPQPAYPGYAGPGIQTGQANGPGIASLVLGIIGLVTFWAWFIGLPVSIVGLVLAAVGMRRLQGKGLAIAGLVLSILGVVVSGCIAVIALAALGSHPY